MSYHGELLTGKLPNLEKSIIDDRMSNHPEISRFCMLNLEISIFCMPNIVISKFGNSR